MKIEKVEVFGMDATNVHAVLALPGGPGLGVALNDAKLEKYRLDLKAAA